jgi:short-subunit dehydrogenase
VLVARREDPLDELAEQCVARGATAWPVVGDVSNSGDMQLVATTALSDAGGLDVWINNAGVGALGRFDEVPLEDHVKVVTTDLLGVIFGSYHALRHFRSQGRGVLINVASALGKMAAPYYASYAAAKHGVVGLGAALRQELREAGEDGIRVCTVMPMAMDTPFYDHAANYTGHEAVPVPPLYDPQKVIDTIVELITEPEDEVVVGGAGKIVTALHGLMPTVVEHALGKITHREQIEKADPAPATRGSVHDPIPEGTTVHGGRR